jgi:hypothetical protein
VWGSNGVAANYGMELLVANVLAPDPAFVESAQDDLHYLLGRNAFSLSGATQVGMNTRTTGQAERTRMPSRGQDCCRAVRMPGDKTMR